MHKQTIGCVHLPVSHVLWKLWNVGCLEGPITSKLAVRKILWVVGTGEKECTKQLIVVCGSAHHTCATSSCSISPPQPSFLWLRTARGTGPAGWVSWQARARCWEVGGAHCSHCCAVLCSRWLTWWDTCCWCSHHNLHVCVRVWVCVWVCVCVVCVCQGVSVVCMSTMFWCTCVCVCGVCVCVLRAKVHVCTVVTYVCGACVLCECVCVYVCICVCVCECVCVVCVRVTVYEHHVRCIWSVPVCAICVLLNWLCIRQHDSHHCRLDTVFTQKSSQNATRGGGGGWLVPFPRIVPTGFYEAS